uniref:Phospholysine phosphohistidine inorganic pyrophosphate phosphatase n=1 Tax=Coturnix japonica TaxID=93934 RepID=A0A8C2SMC1_COTJA
MAAWARAVRGLLLDISGVLYDSGGEGGGVPIPGSAEAVRRIKASGLKLRFCTNEAQATREKFVKKLQGLGFDISVDEVTAPAPAACRLLKERGLRPHLLVHDDLVPEFADIDKTNPNCVVIGDAAENFSYANLNEAFRVLIGLEKPVLISLGKGRYYKETDGLKLDVGAYMKALEYACDVQAEVVGKPAKAFFESALAEMGVPPEQLHSECHLRKLKRRMCQFCPFGFLSLPTCFNSCQHTRETLTLLLSLLSHGKLGCTTCAAVVLQMDMFLQNEGTLPSILLFSL